MHEAIQKDIILSSYFTICGILSICLLNKLTKIDFFLKKMALVQSSDLHKASFSS